MQKIDSLEQVTAVILAGGLGTRLRAVVSDRPKVLAGIGGKPFLAYLLDHLSASGCRIVVLCTGFLGEQIRQIFGDRYRDLQLSYSRESSPLGTAGALRLALPLVKSESVLIMNGDSFCDANLNSFWEWHVKQKAAASMLLVKMPDTKRYGRVMVNADGRILSFDEKDDKGAPGWINAGIYLVEQVMLRKIAEDRAVSLEREMFPAWMGQGLYGYSSEARFLDIGTPESYGSAIDFFETARRDGCLPFCGN